jgi:hypothetical protein
MKRTAANGCPCDHKQHNSHRWMLKHMTSSEAFHITLQAAMADPLKLSKLCLGVPIVTHSWKNKHQPYCCNAPKIIFSTLRNQPDWRCVQLTNHFLSASHSGHLCTGGSSVLAVLGSRLPIGMFTTLKRSCQRLLM